MESDWLWFMTAYTHLYKYLHIHTHRKLLMLTNGYENSVASTFICSPVATARWLCESQGYARRAQPCRCRAELSIGMAAGNNDIVTSQCKVSWLLPTALPLKAAAFVNVMLNTKSAGRKATVWRTEIWWKLSRWKIAV